MQTVTRRRWKPFAILVAAVGLYWLAMFAATHLPLQTTPKGDPYSLDKLEHVAAFSILSVLLCGMGFAIGIPHRLLYLGVLGVITAYGAIDEVSQSLVRDRTPDVLDWLADIAGAVLGIVAFVAIRRIYVSRQTRRTSSTVTAT